MRAIALFSKGLDSILAVKIIQREGIEVIALHFVIPFCRYKDLDRELLLVEKQAVALDVELKTVILGEDYLEVVKRPKYGYGRNLNPCIDCRIFMLRRAKEIMAQTNASFVVTGEVAGQRPMSQKKSVFSISDKESGLSGLILRPLSAKLLVPTIAEDNQWVNRENLLDIYGRSRIRQKKLADDLGVKEFPQPAGGCLLTESAFCKKVEDLLEREEFTCENVALLKIGRHFRLTTFFKLIVGRDEPENEKLRKVVKPKDLYFEPRDLPGPSAVGKGAFDEQLKILSARIVAGYTAGAEQEVKILIKGDSFGEEVVSVKGVSREIFKRFII